MHEFLVVVVIWWTLALANVFGTAIGEFTGLTEIQLAEGSYLDHN